MRKPIKFRVIKTIKWDCWGTLVVVFSEGQECEGEGRFNEQGQLIYASAESPYYEGISDSIPIDSIELIN